MEAEQVTAMQGRVEAMVEEGVRASGQGAILFDRGLVAQATIQWLDPAHWRGQGDAGRGGRGEVWFVKGPFGAGVLRHYRRGGMIGRVVRDRYLFTGAARTRSFREFRLLAEMRRRGLPVPAPLVAGYRRDGAMYRADLLMQQVPDATTLAQCLGQVIGDDALLRQLGHVLGRFHAHGVEHVDLNAHNLLLESGRRWWLIDFDRGSLRVPAQHWQQRGMKRLQRSLLKLGAATLPQWPQAWKLLIAAYEQALHSAVERA
jgi:3-deoxy-D-manno-octulosonic acid kinase